MNLTNSLKNNYTIEVMQKLSNSLLTHDSTIPPVPRPGKGVEECWCPWIASPSEIYCRCYWFTFHFVQQPSASCVSKRVRVMNPLYFYLSFLSWLNFTSVYHGLFGCNYMCKFLFKQYLGERSGGNMVALEEHASKRDRLGRNYASLRPVDAFHLKHSL